jgi:hypothetical protein
MDQYGFSPIPGMDSIEEFSAAFISLMRIQIDALHLQLLNYKVSDFLSRYKWNLWQIIFQSLAIPIIAIFPLNPKSSNVPLLFSPSYQYQLIFIHQSFSAIHHFFRQNHLDLQRFI